MGWSDDDDEDALLIDLAAVEDRRARHADERDVDHSRGPEAHSEERTVHDDDVDSDGPHPRPPSTDQRRMPASSSAAASATVAGAGEARAGTVQSNAQIALLYLTHKIAEEVGRERGVRFSKEMLSCARDVVLGYVQTLGRDVERFAKHAKHTVVNVDDVMLVARRNESLTSALEAFKQREGIGAKKRGQGQSRKRKAASVSDDDKEDEEDDSPLRNQRRGRATRS